MSTPVITAIIVAGGSLLVGILTIVLGPRFLKPTSASELVDSAMTIIAEYKSEKEEAHQREKDLLERVEHLETLHEELRTARRNDAATMRRLTDERDQALVDAASYRQATIAARESEKIAIREAEDAAAKAREASEKAALLEVRLSAAEASIETLQRELAAVGNGHAQSRSPETDPADFDPSE